MANAGPRREVQEQLVTAHHPAAKQERHQRDRRQSAEQDSENEKCGEQVANGKQRRGQKRCNEAACNEEFAFAARVHENTMIPHGTPTVCDAPHAEL